VNFSSGQGTALRRGTGDILLSQPRGVRDVLSPMLSAWLFSWSRASLGLMQEQKALLQLLTYLPALCFC